MQLLLRPCGLGRMSVDSEAVLSRRLGELGRDVEFTVLWPTLPRHMSFPLYGMGHTPEWGTPRNSFSVVCKMLLNGIQQYLDHIKGKRHRNNLKNGGRGSRRAASCEDSDLLGWVRQCEAYYDRCQPRED